MPLPYLYQEIDRIYAKTIGKGMRSLCVTSSLSEEGTTSVVCALAQRATAVNMKVLIVDLNLQNPFVSRMIDTNKPSVESKPAPSAYYLPPPDWDDAISHQAVDIQIKGGPGVSVIPRPDIENNPVKFREHSMLNKMIEYWQQHHDCIIFDTSPLCLVNQRNIPPQHVATCCDGAIMVVKAGRTQVHQLTEAMEVLNTVDVNLVGTIMNDFDNPLLGVELIRQCQKLGQRMPRLARMLTRKIKKSAFLFADF